MSTLLPNRRKALHTAALLGGSAVAASAATPAIATTTSPTAKPSGGASADLTPDEQLDHIVHKLTKVPAHLQHANPKTYKNYKKELDKHLGDVKVVNAESITGISPAKIHAGGGGGGRGVQPMFGFWSCMLSVGQIIVEYGISIFKVVSWIRKARRIFGGVRNMWKAIKERTFLIHMGEVGEEMVDVFKALLGADGVVKSCF